METIPSIKSALNLPGSFFGGAGSEYIYEDPKGSFVIILDYAKDYYEFVGCVYRKGAETRAFDIAIPVKNLDELRQAYTVWKKANIVEW